MSLQYLAHCLTITATIVHVGCGSSPPLLESGTRVQVTVESRVVDCEYIGPVTSRVGANFGTYEGNVEYATNDVRNQAGRKGATHVVLSPPIKDSMASWGKIGSSDCNNCVALTGQSYRCSNRHASSRRSTLPSGMGEERGSCYPNRTCNEGLTCLSDLCVRLAADSASNTPTAPESPAQDPSQRSSSPSPLEEIRLLQLGDLDSATRAEPQLQLWKGRKLRVTREDGSVLEDVLATIRHLRLFLRGGADIPMEDVTQVELLD